MGQTSVGGRGQKLWTSKNRSRTYSRYNRTMGGESLPERNREKTLGYPPRFHCLEHMEGAQQLDI